MALFKRTYTTINPKTGRKQKRKTAKWYGQFRDPSGRLHRVPLATDKVAAAQMLADHIKRAERGEAGVLDPFGKHNGKPLTEHLEDFERSLGTATNTPAYVRETVAKVKAIVEGCGFRFIRDINPEPVAEWLKEQRTTRKRFGLSTSNHYRNALVTFSRWLVESKRAPISPYKPKAELNAETDVRCQRRALTDEEIAWLLESTEAGPLIGEISGADRAMLYRVALQTGLRASELKSLTAKSFNLNSIPPIVTVEACYSKHRRTDVLPLHPDLVAKLRDWFQKRADEQGAVPSILPINGTSCGKPARLWTGSAVKARRTAETIRRDLAKARSRWIENSPDAMTKERREKSDCLKYQDSAGRVADFHSLRHSHITRVLQSGVAPQHAQKLARHADIRLTLQVYGHLQTADLDGRLQQVPSLPSTTMMATTSAATG